jgi:hypothetical protein
MRLDADPLGNCGNVGDVLGVKFHIALSIIAVRGFFA